MAYGYTCTARSLHKWTCELVSNPKHYQESIRCTQSKLYPVQDLVTRRRAKRQLRRRPQCLFFLRSYYTKTLSADAQRFQPQRSLTSISSIWIFVRIRSLCHSTHSQMTVCACVWTLRFLYETKNPFETINFIIFMSALAQHIIILISWRFFFMCTRPCECKSNSGCESNNESKLRGEREIH